MKDLTILQIKKYKGVEGWLLLFCINLTIISPLMIFGNINKSYTQLHPLFDNFPGIKLIFFMSSFLYLLIIVLGIRAGSALWLIKPKALDIAKQFMLIYLGISLFILLIPFLGFLPSRFNDAMFDQLLNNNEIIYPLVVFGCWYTYLCVSKRVVATYLSSSVLFEIEVSNEMVSNGMVDNEKVDNEKVDNEKVDNEKVNKPLVIFLLMLMGIIIVLAIFALIKFSD